MQTLSQNPLSRHFRQPKLFIKLPSKGQYYPSGSLEFTPNGEYPVMAMTAKDELIFKTPDALLNGQSTISVIQSCMPNIKDGWKIPSIDIDAILIAIRIATYGEMMDITVKIPNTEEERTFSLDLRILLDQLTANEFDNVIIINNLKFEISPLNYQTFTEIAIKTFEEQRLFRTINDNSLDEIQKLKLFNESFNRLTDINIKQVAKSIKAVQYENEPPVTNVDFINEFFENVDKEIFKGILEHVEKQRTKFSIKPLNVKFTSEDKEKFNAPESIDIPITFDQTNFFA